jgi:hypothetical protein
MHKPCIVRTPITASILNATMMANWLTAIAA